MKKLLSILLSVLLCASVMSGVALAGPSSDGEVFIRDYIPGEDKGVIGNAGKISVETVAADGTEPAYYLYTSKNGDSDAPLGSIACTVHLMEMTFMLTESGSAIGYMPTFYDENLTTSDKISYKEMIRVSETGGVVVSNIADANGTYLLNTTTDIRWSSNKFKLIPYVSMNEKHTIRVEHNPDNLTFTLWFDSNKITFNENAQCAYVKSSATSDGADANAKGPRFVFDSAKANESFKVYNLYIRATQAKNNDKAESAKVFSGTREYTYGEYEDNSLFGYYADIDGNAVLTGFKYGDIPTAEYTSESPLVFPSSIDGYPVTAIADCAFNQDANGYKTKTSGNYAGYDNIYAISLPATLKTIGQYSMNSFKNIVELIIPDSVTEIGNYAFDRVYNSGNKTPSKLILGNSLTKIGNCAFNYFGYNGAVISEVAVPASVTEIGTQAFVLTGIRTIIFEGTPTIGTNMFRNNPWLRNIVFLKDVELGSGFLGLAGNQNTYKNVCIIGSKAMYDAVVANAKDATVADFDYAYSDIFAYKSADVPSVYYWGTDDDATLIKAKYNKTTKNLESCELVSMTAGNSYALELGNSAYNVKNMFWSKGDCKPLAVSVKY